MDIKSLANPYDFAYPVTKQNFFIGRSRELEEIRYYLGQAKFTHHPINIALLGRRSAGKTSFLNIIENEAKQNSFCTVRIDLDEGDITSQLTFFGKLFECLLSSVCELGSFGGLTAKTYDTFIEMTSAYNIPEDKTFCPFLFPIQFAIANRSNNPDAQVSSFNFKKDLITIKNEVNSPIIILFDECNVLANCCILLQKLRNIFMNLDGFMLVFAGTPELFPVIDDVFSPITRQFKKIIIGPFEDEKDTQICITKPLEEISITDTASIFDDLDKAIKEIHDLSGGYPYEIQLICHMMFKKVQLNKSAKMKLDISILEEVRKELEVSDKVIARPILTKIRSFSKVQLQQLSIFCDCNDITTFDQIWYIEYLIHGEKRYSKDMLNKCLEFFVSEGVIHVNENNLIKFAGDDFEKIYIKYYAKEQGIDIRFLDNPIYTYINIRISNFFSCLKEFNMTSQQNLDTDLEDVVKSITDKDLLNEVSFDTDKIRELLYLSMVSCGSIGSMSVLEISYDFNWLKYKSWIIADNPKSMKNFAKCEEKLKILVERAPKIGGTIESKIIEIPTVSIDDLAENILLSTNIRNRNYLATLHAFKATICYVTSDNKGAALHANLAYKYNGDYDDYEIRNNLAYILISNGKLTEASDILLKIEDNSENIFMNALVKYNIGILEALNQNFMAAYNKMEECLKLIQTFKERSNGCTCLFVLRNDNGFLKCEESFEPDFYEFVLECLNVLKIFI